MMLVVVVVVVAVVVVAVVVVVLTVVVAEVLRMTSRRCITVNNQRQTYRQTGSTQRLGDKSVEKYSKLQ